MIYGGLFAIRAASHGVRAIIGEYDSAERASAVAFALEELRTGSDDAGSCDDAGRSRLRTRLNRA